VVIPTPGPEHAYLVRAAIGGGKDVYSEWPLTTSTTESEELLQLAEEQGVRHVVGMQRRFAPSASYAHDLISQGYVGTIRGVHMSVGVDAFAPTLPERHRWSIEEANFTNLLSIYGGHFFDLLFHLVGPPGKFTAITQNQFPATTIEETGEQVPNSSAHEVVMIGTLQRDGSVLHPARRRTSPQDWPADRHHRNRRCPAHHQPTRVPEQARQCPRRDA